jgi:fructose-1,6-bisphosphatase
LSQGGREHRLAIFGNELVAAGFDVYGETHELGVQEILSSE